MNACIDWSMIHGARAEHERDAGAAGCWRWTLWLCGRMVGGEVRARLAEGKGCDSLTESRYMAESAFADSGHENRELVHFEIRRKESACGENCAFCHYRTTDTRNRYTSGEGRSCPGVHTFEV